MRHANGSWSFFDPSTNLLMNFFHLRPGDGTFQCIGQDAKILQIFAHVWIGKAALFPVLSNRCKTQVKCMIFSANLANFPVDIGGKSSLAIGHPQQETFFHRLEPGKFQQSICRGAGDVIETHCHIRFLGV